MAKLSRVVAGIDEKLRRIEAMIVFASGDGEAFLEEFNEFYNPAPPPSRAELKEMGSEPEEIEATQGAIDLAKEAGIDLATVEGSGADGKVIKPDVVKALKAAE